MPADTFGCIKNTIRVRSGAWFDFLDPKPDQFTIEDIAGALSKICRFGGQIDCFYSVAEHSVNCAEQASTDGLSVETQLALLLHDATEAFCGDVVKPLKIMLPEYDAIEARVEAVIAKKFGVDFGREKPFIREIDRAMLFAERRRMFSADGGEWPGERDTRVLPIEFVCWQPGDAERVFLGAAKALGVA